MSANEEDSKARADPESAPVQEIREHKDVQEALEEAAAPVEGAPPITKKRNWTWLVFFGLLAGHPQRPSNPIPPNHPNRTNHSLL